MATATVTDNLPPTEQHLKDVRKRKFSDQISDGSRSPSKTPHLASIASEDNGDGGAWTTVVHRRSKPPRHTAEACTRMSKEKFVVLLRPKNNASISAMSRRGLAAVIAKVAPHASLNVLTSTRVDLRRNSATVTLYNQTHAKNLCGMSSMTIDGRTIEFDAQLLTSHGCSRGVIRVDPNDTDEDLRNNTTCESANILHIKRLGRTDYALVTFDTSHPPKIVRNYFELCPVKPYVPRTLVCYRCHKDGHLQKHCPNAAVCATCGRGHKNEACLNATPYCNLCHTEGHTARDPVCPTKAKRLQQVRERIEHKVRKRARHSKATNNTAPPDLANNIAFPSLESKIKPTAPVQGRIQPVCETEVMTESSTEMSDQSAASTSTTASRKQVSRPNRLPRRSRQPHMPDSINILRQEIASQRRHLQSLQKQLQKQLDLALADEKMENEDQTSQSLQECSPSRTQTPHCAAASGFPCIDLPTLVRSILRELIPYLKAKEVTAIETEQSSKLHSGENNHVQQQ